MPTNKLLPSELILNDDGSVYHIHLKEEHIAPTVLLVGDQGRVHAISAHFDEIEYKIQNREFITHTGTYKGKRLTAISTGIGCDNIDIVVNELDAAINIDLKKRELKAERKSLNLIRLGTSGAVHADIPVGSFVLSEFGLGFDGLIYYYNYDLDEQDLEMTLSLRNHLRWPPELSLPYAIAASPKLLDLLSEGTIKGVTATASGFYGPQGRRLYLQPAISDLREKLSTFNHEGHRITNFEMETSALYGLGKILGHHCATCCAIIANRARKEYADDYKSIVQDMIKMTLDRLTS